MADVVPTREDGVARFRLPTTFRFVHEPLTDANTAIPLLGHGEVIDDLATQLRYSDGGTFLVTGFRGVGKTTVVRRAIERARRDTAAERHVIHVDLNVARPMATGELLFAVIRRLFEQLVERDLLDGLSESAQRTLILAYTRTSLQLAHKRSESNEWGGSIGASASTGPGVLAAVLGSLLPKLDLSAKRTSSLAVEASFLTYSETDVEHDFVRIVRELRRPQQAKRRFWRRTPPEPKKIQVVVVVDELDKLTAGDGGVEAFEKLLLGLKNVLTSGGAHFVFVAGPDVHALASSDRVRGSGIYESVFAWHAYVPCLWAAPTALVEQLLVVQAPVPEPLQGVLGFLRYASRGIPRRLLQEFNALVEWDGTDPVLAIDPHVRHRAQFYDRMRMIIDEHLGVEDESSVTTMEEDQRRLASYFVLDWILGSGGRVFEAADIVGETPKDAITDTSLPLEHHGVEMLLNDLSLADVLMKRGPGSPDITIIVPARSSMVASYHLAEETLAEIRRLTGVGARTLAPAGMDRRLVARPSASIPSVPPTVPDHREAVAPLRPPSVAPTPVSGTVSSLRPETVWPRWEGTYLASESAGDFILGRLIGSGAMGSVYEAEDTRLGRKVAIKLIERRSAMADPDVRSRFHREVAIAASLDHPGLVQTLGRIDDGSRMGLVMGLVTGPTLADVARPVPPATVVRWGAMLCEPLQYLADHGVARIDLKPANIIISNDRPVIVDLGLAKSVLTTGGYSTVDGLVGTPAYMAPEQFGGSPPDIRSDLYSLGIVLFELLGGQEFRPPLETMVEILARTATEEVPVDQLDVSPDLRAVLRRVTAMDPDGRYSEPRVMAEDLRALPEYAEDGPIIVT